MQNINAVGKSALQYARRRVRRVATASGCNAGNRDARETLQLRCLGRRVAAFTQLPLYVGV